MLASVATVALTDDGEDAPTASDPSSAVTGLSPASTAPIATHPTDPRAGNSASSGPGAERGRDGDEPQRDDDGGRSDRDNDSGPDRDSLSRNDDSDHGTSPADKPNRDDGHTIDPDPDTDGGSDNGDGTDGDNDGDEKDQSEQDQSDQGDSNDDDSDKDDSDPTTPPDDGSDHSGTIDRRDALERCRKALIGTPNLEGIGSAIRSCVDDLVGTPLARVDATLNRTVSDLLGALGGNSSDGHSGGGLLCSIFGTCREG